MLSAFAGRSLWIDEAVYASESATGDRNRALAYLLRSHGVIESPVELVGRDLLPAVLGAGHRARSRRRWPARSRSAGSTRSPGDRVVAERVARDVISLMSSCGMYDFSGEWLLRVGLPAKSGVSGGILAVAPSQFGVAAFSPRLDAHGNTVRGSAIVSALSEGFGMHLLEPHENFSEPAISVVETTGGPRHPAQRRARLRGGGAGADRAPRTRRVGAGWRRAAARRPRARPQPPGRARRAPLASSTSWDPDSGSWSEAEGQTRRSRLIDIASVLCRCGHSWARPEPSAGATRFGSVAESASITARASSSSIDVAERPAHFGDDPDGLGEMRRAGHVGDDAAGAQRHDGRAQQLGLQLDERRHVGW